jgi:hypothetical protein
MLAHRPGMTKKPLSVPSEARHPVGTMTGMTS